MNPYSARNLGKTMADAVEGYVKGRPVDHTCLGGQVASAVTSSLKNGASLQRAAAVGTAIVGAKVAAGVAVATAAAPVVATVAVVGAGLYGLKKLLR